MAKYIVTGGCGFIGSQLTDKLLAQGHEVIIIDDLSNPTNIPQQATLIEKDLNEIDSVRDVFKDVDGCYHLAAKPAANVSLGNWFAFHNTNLEGSLKVFKAAIEAGNIPIVYASTCGVYNDKNQFPLSEEQHLRPYSSYGCDKLAMELNASYLAREYKLPSVGLRIFNVYGPHQSLTSPYSGVITHFITSLLEDKPMIVFGNGQQNRDFVFVEDVVDNLIHAMNNVRKDIGVVNLCGHNPITITDLAEVIADKMKKEYVIDYQKARPADALSSYGCVRKMQKYGFKLNYGLQQGLQKTIKYFQDNKNT